MSLWPQRCKVCGRVDKFNFTVSDEIWKKVVPMPFQNHVVCLTCFDAFASLKGIDYANDISAEIYFDGDKGSFELRIVTRSSAPSF